ncbi:hypothetical protein TPHV1_10111 [Treponema phagedenis]|uniref:Uncharacterized protein n=1 Tax=Treponema phagedenis TaxID=162 RepID=A0A0B7GPR6_TREPH|nr:hypothetical protein TPHV1_10111 [Treponema phagedenis]
MWKPRCKKNAARRKTDSKKLLASDSVNPLLFLIGKGRRSVSLDFKSNSILSGIVI